MTSRTGATIIRSDPGGQEKTVLWSGLGTSSTGDGGALAASGAGGAGVVHAVASESASGSEPADPRLRIDSDSEGKPSTATSNSANAAVTQPLKLDTTGGRALRILHSRRLELDVGTENLNGLPAGAAAATGSADSEVGHPNLVSDAADSSSTRSESLPAVSRPASTVTSPGAASAQQGRVEPLGSLDPDTGVFTARNPVFAAMSRHRDIDHAPSRSATVGVPTMHSTSRAAAPR